MHHAGQRKALDDRLPAKRAAPGKVLRVSQQALDGIEGIWPRNMGEYAKRLLTLPVRLHGGVVQDMELLVYEALPPTVQGRPGIAASDWLAWYQAQGRVHPGTAFALNSEQA